VKTDEPTTPAVNLTLQDRYHLVEILERRANEVASFKRDMEEAASQQAGAKVYFYSLPGSVELALTREVRRLRALADKVRPPAQDGEDEI